MVEQTDEETEELVPPTMSGSWLSKSIARTTKISLFKMSSCKAISSWVKVLAAVSVRPKDTAIVSEVFLNPMSVASNTQCKKVT